MSKNVVLTLESRFMDEYGEYANLPVFNAHGDIVGYVGGEVPESGNPCEFNRLGDEGFTYCASATEVVGLKAENAKLRELVRDMHRRLSNANLCAMCPDAEVCCLGLGWDQCTMLDDLEDRMRELGIEVGR